MLAACSCSLHELGRAYSDGLQGTAVVGPAKRPGGAVVVNDERHDPVATSSLTEANSPRLSSRRVRIEKNSSAWFNQEA